MIIKEMRSAPLSSIICYMYRYKKFRKFCLVYCNRQEGGRFFSLTLRKILKEYHGVSVGHYSYGECTNPGSWPAGKTFQLKNKATTKHILGP